MKISLTYTQPNETIFCGYSKASSMTSHINSSALYMKSSAHVSKKLLFQPAQSPTIIKPRMRNYKNFILGHRILKPSILQEVKHSDNFSFPTSRTGTIFSRQFRKSSLTVQTQTSSATHTIGVHVSEKLLFSQLTQRRLPNPQMQD
jgi:hypothetical protein